MILPQELQGQPPSTQLPPHSGEPAMTNLFSGPDDGARQENASSSEGASFPVTPRMTAFMQDPDTLFHQRPSLATIDEMRQ